ncbi:MAG TPA: UDP-glucose 4-epimerase GalE [Thermodesulfobacteriota bacterium]|nr:UDP-glucose 4-epimerase GalE [Thermodesulfobacteriota bacterium]
MGETNHQILVTGGAGYIGSHVVKELIRRGYRAVVYDNLQTGHRKAVKNAPLIQGDLADKERLIRAFQSYSIQAVMHFAADCLVNESMKEPLKFINNNIRNGLHLLEAMNQWGVKKFVFSSSCAVYGEPVKVPIPEDHPCLPTNVYGETKWVFEKFLQAYHDAQKLDFISLRYFNAAGADPDGELGEDHQKETHLIPLAFKALLGKNRLSIYGTDYDTPDGTCIRDYIHVMDLAQAHFLALERLLQGGESATYNLGNGNGYSVREVIAMAEKVSAKKMPLIEAPRRAGDPAQLVASSEKIKKELGWTPKYPKLESIIQSAWNWHRTHPNGYAD